MSAENWVEIELRATDQAGREVVRHVEYRANDPDPEQAVGEIVRHVADHAGAERIHDANAGE